MKHKFYLIILFLVMLFVCHDKMHASTYHYGGKEQHVLIDHSDEPQAIITDTSWQLHLCNQRFERTGHSNTFPSMRKLPLHLRYSSHIHNASLARYHVYGLVLSAPIRMSLPCRYYVLTLQRMLC